MSFHITTRRIPDPLRNSRTWMLLVGVVTLGALACVVEPSPGGANLRGLRLPPCPLKFFTGIPCPFCGLTTATAWLARGNLPAAWHSNVLSPFIALTVLITGIYALACRLVAGRTIHLDLDSSVRRSLWIVVVSAVALSWARNLLFA